MRLIALVAPTLLGLAQAAAPWWQIVDITHTVSDNCVVSYPVVLTISVEHFR
jgi:hypothetical protein